MIDHLFLPVANLARSVKFYRAALAPIGYTPSKEFSLEAPERRGVGFGPEGDRDFYVVEGAATVTAGHVAFRVTTRVQVDGFHAAALNAGGRDNGAPGLSPGHGPDYYSAYVFDPDGHNIEVVCWESA